MFLVKKNDMDFEKFNVCVETPRGYKFKNVSVIVKMILKLNIYKSEFFITQEELRNTDIDLIEALAILKMLQSHRRDFIRVYLYDSNSIKVKIRNEDNQMMNTIQNFVL